MPEATLEGGEVRYSDQIKLSVPPGYRSLIEEAGRRAGMKSTDWHRQQLAAALRALGIDPAAIPDRSAGALHDVMGGRQRYAKIDGDQIKFVSYHDEHPGEGWLPVFHVDSESFDLATQWRLAPVYTIEPGSKVLCTYPIVAKSLEAI